MTSPSPIQTTSHLVTIPHPPCPYFLVQILHLQQSLSISIFPSPNPALVPGLLPPVSNGSSEGANKTEPNEEALDLELAKALEESGRIQPSVQPPSSSTNAIQDQLPLPRLSKEWSVAMIPPNSGKSASSTSSTTSIFRTPSDLSRSMSHRLALKFSQVQLFLNLDLPESLLPEAQMSGMGTMGSEKSKGLLMLEKGIGKAIESGIKEVEESRS